MVPGFLNRGLELRLIVTAAQLQRTGHHNSDSRSNCARREVKSLLVPPPPTEGQTKYQRNLQVFFGRISFDNRQIAAARNWWLERMLLSKRPLEEKLTFFWHGHLTTSNEIGRASCRERV